MIKLSPVQACDVPDFIEIADGKLSPRRENLKANQVWVIGRLKEQRDVFLELRQCEVEQVDEQLKRDLIHCYEVPNKAFREVRAAVFSDKCNVHGICAYCLANFADSLDHYLPKNSYPEFAVMPENLIPCCIGCNSLKPNNGEMFECVLNPYFCTVQASEFIECELVSTCGVLVPKFHIVDSDETSPHLELIQNHVKTFGILSKYTRKAALCLAEELEGIESLSKVLNQSDIVKYYKKRSLKVASVQGANHWKASLFSALVRYMEDNAD